MEGERVSADQRQLWRLLYYTCCVPGKTFAHLLLMHDRDHLLKSQRPKMSWFTFGYMTTKQILLVLSRNSDLCFDTGFLYSTLISRGPYSVHRKTFWDLVIFLKIPAVIVGLVTSLSGNPGGFLILVELCPAYFLLFHE